MGRRRLIWQLFPSFLLVTLLAVVAVAGYATYALRASWLDRIAHDLEIRARLAGGRIVRTLGEDLGASIQPLTVTLGTESGARISVIDESGQILGDSEELPSLMESHANRPEFLAALAEGIGTNTRPSPTLGENMMYVAVAFDRATLGTVVVRAALPLTEVEATIRQVQGRIAYGALLSALAATVLSLIFSRRIARPLREMRRGAARFARGEFDRPLPVSGTEETEDLAEVLNQMARQLDERIADIERQRSEREAILASMAEGVLAVDIDQKVLIVNRAAASLLEIDGEGALGKSMQEAVRNPHFHALVKRAFRGDAPAEGILSPANAEGRQVQVTASILTGPDGRAAGVVAVLNDVTRLHRLERVRSDFVANVSHELKTPITAIKGFIETLLSGAMDNAQDAKRFLDIISRQADRLGAIIDDLLVLSRLEQEGQGLPLPRGREALLPVLAAAVEVCSVKAEAKGVAVRLRCPPDLSAVIAAPLIEQAVINLVDNAIKYSDSGTTVTVSAARADREVRITVRDQGVGIPKQHLDRVFERFYRVDKARSRNMGGTGLGLSIVKHIAQSHGGRVSVQSTPGVGSAFTVHLPEIADPAS